MTLLQLIESVRQHFPNIGRKQIVIDINSVYRRFAHETRLLKKSADAGAATAAPSTAQPTDQAGSDAKTPA